MASTKPKNEAAFQLLVDRVKAGTLANHGHVVESRLREAGYTLDDLKAAIKTAPEAAAKKSMPTIRAVPPTSEATIGRRTE